MLCLVARLTRAVPVGRDWLEPVVKVSVSDANAPAPGLVGKVADAPETAHWTLDTVVLPAGKKTTFPQTSQSPAVNGIEVTFALTPLDSETADPAGIFCAMYSPMLPAWAESFVV